MWDEEHEFQIRSIDSDVETAKFGFPIRRVLVGGRVLDDFSGLKESCAIRHNNETIFLQFDSGQNWIRRFLIEYPDHVITTPDTQYWSVDPSTIHHRPADGIESSFRRVEVAHISDSEEIEKLVQNLFLSYENHYSSNPKLDLVEPVNAYVDWALSKLETKGSTFILREKEKSIGYALTELNKDSVNILLAGVLPEAEGNGIYREFLGYLVQQSSRKTYISTQSNNIRVQRSWAAVGFKPTRSFSRVHLQRNSL